MHLKSRDISYQQVRANCAVYESAAYAGRQGGDMLRVRYQELTDDIYDAYVLGLSSDHGETWHDEQELELGGKVAGGTLRQMICGAFPDPDRDALLMLGMRGVLPNDSPVDGMSHYLPFYRLSRDLGQSWTDHTDIIQQGDAYSAAHPFRDVTIGSNALHICNQAMHAADGRLLVPVHRSLVDEEGNFWTPPGAYTYTEAAVLTGSWGDGDQMEWQLSDYVSIPPEQSLRGAIEPTLAELPDGRILMVLRANAGTDGTPGRKWHSVSHDGGMTWAKPSIWTYEDGKAFYSPSSISRLIAHSTGNIYWVGNITPQPPTQNGPRYPLVMGRVDPETLRLVRDGVLVIDTREEGDSDGLQLSNFDVYEDRRNQDFVLRMTRWDGQPSGGANDTDASVYRYRIGVGD